jgi:RNAse (barnase) inhibitor barstar
MGSETGVSPLYRFVDDESQRVFLASCDIDGYFVDSPQEESGAIGLIGTSMAPDQVPRLLQNVRLQVMDVQGEVIGTYYIGRVDLRAARASERVSGATDVEASFFGYSFPYPWAGKFWQLWAAGHPTELGEWRKFPSESHGSWLHVAQTVWFGSGRNAKRHSEDATCVIDGSGLANIAGFYCALGEAVNGPGGYFGSNLDALADCLASSRSNAAQFRLVWQNFAESQEDIGAGVLGSAISVLREFGVEVDLG